MSPLFNIPKSPCPHCERDMALKDRPPQPGEAVMLQCTGGAVSLCAWCYGVLMLDPPYANQIPRLMSPLEAAEFMANPNFSKMMERREQLCHMMGMFG